VGARFRLTGISRVSLVLAGAVCAASLMSGAAFASSWAIVLHAGSTGEAQAQPMPSAPATASAACVSSTQQKVTVTWSAVTHATSYTVLYSTTSATSGYAVEVSGQTGTSWTSGTLGVANYWFEVEGYEGTHWVSSPSSATAETTISTTGTKCTQP
jgi:hypothetical protein